MDDQSGAKKKEIRTPIAVFAIIAALALTGIIIWLIVGGSGATENDSSAFGGELRYSDAAYIGSNRYYSVNLLLRSDKTFDMEMANNATSTRIVHKLYGKYEFIGSGEGESTIVFTLPDGTESSCRRMKEGSYEYIALSGLEEWLPTVYKM